MIEDRRDRPSGEDVISVPDPQAGQRFLSSPSLEDPVAIVGTNP
jgi:hypothetical protein